LQPTIGKPGLRSIKDEIYSTTMLVHMTVSAKECQLLYSFWWYQLTLCYRKATLVAFNTCPLKFIHNSFDPGATELKLPSFYSGHPGVSNDASYEAKISSQENQHHLEYTKEV